MIELMDSSWAAGYLSAQWPAFRGKPDLYDPRLPLFLRLGAGIAREPTRQAAKYLPQTYLAPMANAYLHTISFAARFIQSLGPTVAMMPAYEWLMQANPYHPEYRDHILHQTWVACVGDWLLDQRIGARTILDRCMDEYAKHWPALTGSTVRTAWWLAALFHDTGYPAEFLWHQADTIRRGMHTPVCPPTMGRGWPGALFRARRYLPHHVSRVDARRLAGKHDVLGAVNLIEAEERYRRFARAMGGEGSAFRERRTVLFSMVADAIVQHHDPHFPGNVPLPFEQSPLGYLLVLSDEIQEFGRRQGVPQGGTDTTEMRYPVPVPRVRVALNTTKRALRLVYHYSQAASAEADWPPPRGNGTPRTPAMWKSDKQKTLESSIDCNTGSGLIRSLTVDVRPTP